MAQYANRMDKQKRVIGVGGGTLVKPNKFVCLVFLRATLVLPFFKKTQSAIPVRLRIRFGRISRPRIPSL